MHINELEKWDGKKSLWIASPKGTHGAGKSTIIHTLTAESKDVVKVYYPELFTGKNGKKAAATLLRDLGIIIVGEYKTQCGGCDVMKKPEIQKVLNRLWTTNYNILYEGCMVASTKATYPELHRKLRMKRGYPNRIELWPFLYVHPEMSVIRSMARGSARSKDKGVRIMKVLEKHNNFVRWKPFYDSLDRAIAWWIDTHKGQKHVMAMFRYMADNAETIIGGNNENVPYSGIEFHGRTQTDSSSTARRWHYYSGCRKRCSVRKRR